MNQSIFTITENVPLTSSVMRMKLSGDTSAITRPGQFINILIDGLFLRRPISVCDYCDEDITIIYKIVGKGTEKMSKMQVGQKLDVLTGLGNGYDTSFSGDRPLLIGGGVGVPPLYNLAKVLIAQGKQVTVLVGFSHGSDAFYIDEFKALGANVIVATSDGSMGVKGRVTSYMDIDYSYIYICGPESMLRSVHEKCVTGGQFSFEERMGCGFGACMGCSCKTITGYKRICKDGPVLYKEEILWQTQK
ncbi:MAG: dihydroorotate dehydrogenase electron transfer subunit [Clostridia bacterium]|nr:dihydroorotate dehydrogenase electron transfer subunit [Clostridia bacterium]